MVSRRELARLMGEEVCRATGLNAGARLEQVVEERGWLQLVTIEPIPGLAGLTYKGFCSISTSGPEQQFWRRWQIAHELGVFFLHPAEGVHFWFRHYGPPYEDEACVFAWHLLVNHRTVLRMKRKGAMTSEIAARFSVPSLVVEAYLQGHR